MRLYALKVQSPLDSSMIASNSSAASQLLNFSTLNTDGSNNGNALQLEFDIPEYAYGDPAGFATLKLSGVNFTDVLASKNLNGGTVSLIGGMSKGLPLANPSQAGVILIGTVQQAFGNWQGNDVSLEMIVSPKAGTLTKPVNLAYSWQQGVSMQDMVTQALGIAFPGCVITGGFDPSLVYTQDAPFFYQTLPQFAAFVLETSKAINPDPSYLGAQITSTPAGFLLFDGTNPPPAKEISPLDMIGNATWLDFATMQQKLVLRADIKVGDIVSMPKGSNVINTPNSFTQYRNTTAFQGLFQVIRIRHVGNSRQPDANSWCTIIDCIVKGST